MDNQRYRLLIVDDESAIRGMLQEFLDGDYEVTACSNAAEALEAVKSRVFDLVISDINMPGMKGYTLLEKIRILSPSTRVALITAYNIDNYIRLARNHGITNIIAKTTPFNFDELGALVQGLTTGDIFGLDRHFQQPRLLADLVIRSSHEAKQARADLIGRLPPLPHDQNEIKLVLDEIITNALYHSPALETGEKKYTEYQPVDLLPDEFIYLRAVQDNDKVGVSILDRQGNLDRNRVLFLLDRHVNAEGVFDESGRGIFISRIFSDRIIINIAPGRQTEVIILFYLVKEPFKGYKPLYINQL